MKSTSQAFAFAGALRLALDGMEEEKD